VLHGELAGVGPPRFEATQKTVDHVRLFAVRGQNREVHVGRLPWLTPAGHDESLDDAGRHAGRGEEGEHVMCCSRQFRNRPAGHLLGLARANTRC